MEVKSIDGNTAAVWVGYAYSEVAAIYPITPSSVMGEIADEWAAEGRKNVFGKPVTVIEMQSEAGAAGAVHGSLTAGALTTTFTASQGLLLMIPNMYKIAGELLPTVFYVSARSLACQSLSIFGDHSDVMAVRNTGFSLMACSSVQDVHDLAIVSHLASLESRIPFLNFFDGFRTSHEVQKVQVLDYDELRELLDLKYVEQFRSNALNPAKPKLKVGAQNPDVYFQGRETVNPFYLKVPEIVKKYMKKLSEKTKREHRLFEYFGHPKAEKIIVLMGSGADTVEEVVNYLVKKGEKVGGIRVHLYRPFSVSDFVQEIPESVRKIAVLDRTKEPGSIGEPLYLDVVSALKDKDIEIIGGRYGLSSKEFNPPMVKAVFDHLDKDGFHNFTVGIEDYVTKSSIQIKDNIITEPEGTIKCKFWGFGSDGTVGATKNAIKIIGDNTELNVQGFWEYDAKKSGGYTISYLRFGKGKFSPYLPTSFNFIALHKPSYIGLYDILEGIEENGIFLLNTPLKEDEVFENFTKEMQEVIIKNKVKVYIIDAFKISQETGLGNRINTAMLAAFFKLSGVLPENEAIKLLKEITHKTYLAKGDKVVEANLKCIDRAVEELKEVKYGKDIKKYIEPKKLIPNDADEFVKKVIGKVIKLKGNEIPVSDMPIDGAVPTGTAVIEKRWIAEYVPKWIPEKCIQCNQCVFVCPHAVIRAKQIEPKYLENAPKNFVTIKSNAKNDKNLEYRIQVYIGYCTGCGNCVNTCPAGALKMVPIEEEIKNGEDEKSIFFDKLPDNVIDGVKENTIKGSQFLKPLFEFHGACAGCGESAYIKIATQLFGDNMIIANATGCSSIYGGTFPTSPYTKTKDGKGPCWANSLFEDNAEYALGMRLAVNSIRKELLMLVEKLLNSNISIDLKESLNKAKNLWEERTKEAKENQARIKEILKNEIKNSSGELKEILLKVEKLSDYFVDKSIWAVGGDGWAYDIGFGGLDHVLASGLDVNLLVLDTEVYSNTGGQASKSTQMGAAARFAISGKEFKKKDLGLMLMSYGYIYVASCAIGANKQQYLNALIEAESYKGPSIIICYSPCINHGLDMSKSVEEEKLAVQCGYWFLYRYNPLLKKEGKNPLIFETPQPNGKFQEFIRSEVRFSSVKKLFPDRAEEIFKKAEEVMIERYNYYKKLAEM